MRKLTNVPLFQSLRFKYGLGLLAALAVAGYVLWDDLGAGFAENGAILLLLGVCVGMHLFMHGGHGRGGHRLEGTHESDARAADSEERPSRD